MELRVTIMPEEKISIRNFIRAKKPFEIGDRLNYEGKPGTIIGRSPYDYSNWGGLWFVTIAYEDGSSRCVTLSGGLHAY